MPRMEYKFDDGRRLYDVDYNSSSGSTMVFTGKIEGTVTAQEIIDKIGDGTFGHRGPTIDRNTFTYTKITD
jgi:TPP-dependent indolepyruvate ferredoxin oxidoreductase alpha subunit